MRTWWDFWENNSRSARNRPWMPSAGNHENELGNGPIGYQAYQTYFSVPEAAGQTEVTRGLWYAFTAGSVRVISIANDDVVYQDGGNSYVRGYSAGAQKAWLEKELAAARGDRDIDWIVVCMHQVAISTADKFNGADLGIREEWVPLFDKYGVDLVVCGHEHHYERSHPIRGQEVERHPDAGPRGDRHRRDRHHQGNGAHGDRRRRNVRPVEPAVLQSAAVPGDHRRRRTRPGDRQASAGLRARSKRLGRRCETPRIPTASRPSPSIRDRIAAASPRSRSPITTWWGRTASWPRSKPSRCAAPAATRPIAFHVSFGSRHRRLVLVAGDERQRSRSSRERHPTITKPLPTCGGFASRRAWSTNVRSRS